MVRPNVFFVELLLLGECLHLLLELLLSCFEPLESLRHCDCHVPFALCFGNESTHAVLIVQLAAASEDSHNEQVGVDQGPTAHLLLRSKQLVEACFRVEFVV